MIDGEEENQGENDEVGVEQKEDAGVIEAPPAAETARGLDHSAEGNDEDSPLPVGAVKVLNVGEAGKKQAGEKCRKRKQYGTHKGAPAQAEDVEEEKQFGTCFYCS